MNKSIAARTAAFGIAALLTLAVLAGLDRLAAQQYHEAVLAAAAQPTVVAVAAKAPRG